MSSIRADLSNKTCVVTGATSGIGRATAENLAVLGARVFLVVRDEARGLAAAKEIAAAAGHDRIEVVRADLSSRAEVVRAADELLDRAKKLHVLVNNAGIWPTERRTSADGHELTFATNVLAYFLLSELLEARLIESAPARIVDVASTFAGDLDLEDLMFERRPFDGRRAYRQSKQANRMLAWERARRLDRTGVTVNAVHPGLVDTRLNRDFKGVVGAVARSLSGFLGRSAANGADTPSYLAAAPEVGERTGELWASRRPRPCEFRDPNAERALWARCAALLGR